MSRQYESTLSGASGGSGDPPIGISNKQVSLANIATAFLIERKSSARRQSSTRRKKRLTTTKTGSNSTASRHSSHTTTVDDIFNQRLSAEEIPCGIATILVSTTNNADNKHRITAVNPIDRFFSQYEYATFNNHPTIR